MTPPASPSNSRDRRHPNVQVEAEPLVDSHRRAGESPATSASTRARMRARRNRFGALLWVVRAATWDFLSRGRLASARTDCPLRAALAIESSVQNAEAREA